MSVPLSLSLSVMSVCLSAYIPPVPSAHALSQHGGDELGVGPADLLGPPTAGWSARGSSSSLQAKTMFKASFTSQF